MSAKQKHTPGPWRAEHASTGFRAPDGGDYQIIAENMICPAIVWEFLEEGAANARLIAAAPDLLAALQAHEQYMLDAGYEGPESAALHPKATENWRRARAAIRAATGAP